MTPREHAMAMANDDTLSEMIWRAQRRVIVVAPGLTTRVADTLARKWWLLQPEQVSVTLDVNPEVCRLGYGELAALQLLEKTAAERHTTLTYETLQDPRFIEALKKVMPDLKVVYLEREAVGRKQPRT